MKQAQHRDFPRVHLDPHETTERIYFLKQPGTHAERGGDLDVPIPDVLKFIRKLYVASPPLLKNGLGKLL